MNMQTMPGEYILLHLYRSNMQQTLDNGVHHVEPELSVWQSPRVASKSVLVDVRDKAEP
jgi:hypothetical protein